MSGSAISSILTILVASVMADGCKRGADGGGPINRGLPEAVMKIGNEQFTLEIANDDEERATGLMNRPSMPANHGMIFVFPGERSLAFYMKNTLIPLDIVYLDADGEVVSIHQMRPHDHTSIPARRPAKYAIELNKGTAERVGLKVGDKLHIPPEARDTDR